MDIVKKELTGLILECTARAADDRPRGACGDDSIGVIEPSVPYGGQTSFARIAITAVMSPIMKMTSPRTKDPIGKGAASPPGGPGWDLASSSTIAPYVATSNPTIMMPRPNHRAGLRSSVERAGFIL
jgi:hypothetical protein